MVQLILGATIVGAIALLVRRSFRRSAARGDEEIDRLGLRAFHDRLMAEIRDRRRPMDHLSLTRVMVGILREVEAVPAFKPGDQQAAVIEPKEPYDQLACEELARLGRLRRTPRPHVYLPAARGVDARN